MPRANLLKASLLLCLPIGACSAPDEQTPAQAATIEDTTAPRQSNLIAAPTGFSGPEAVRYDADQDVYFVGNFNGGGNDLDNNGFISRLQPDGTVSDLHFIAGGSEGVTLHAPRGMYIQGDSLWVADVDAIRAFDRRTGEPLASIDFSDQDVGFLNDVAVDATGAVYVTDTGRDRVYRIQGSEVTVALSDSLLNSPNGITWDAANQRFIVVPYGGAHALWSWEPGSDALEELATSPGAKFDGVEVLADGQILVASQADSSLHLFSGEIGRPIIRTAGRPADIGVDTRRQRVAVPFIDLNQVEIWELPG